MNKHVDTIVCIISVSCINGFNTWCFASHNDTLYTTDSKWYKQLYQHNIMFIYVESTNHEMVDFWINYQQWILICCYNESDSNCDWLQCLQSYFSVCCMYLCKYTNLSLPHAQVLFTTALHGGHGPGWHNLKYM